MLGSFCLLKIYIFNSVYNVFVFFVKFYFLVRRQLDEFMTQPSTIVAIKYIKWFFFFCYVRSLFSVLCYLSEQNNILMVMIYCYIVMYCIIIIGSNFYNMMIILSVFIGFFRIDHHGRRPPCSARQLE